MFQYISYNLCSYSVMVGNIYSQNGSIVGYYSSGAESTASYASADFFCRKLDIHQICPLRQEDKFGEDIKDSGMPVYCLHAHHYNYTFTFNYGNYNVNHL